MITETQIQEVISYVKSLGELSLQIRSNGLQVNTKEDGSPVSNGDRIINEKAIDFLHSKFPDFGIISEELEKEWKDINWFVDPINGTKAYIKGKNSNWNMLFGLVKENAPIFGIIYYPYTKKLQVGGTMKEAVEILGNGNIQKLSVYVNPQKQSKLLCPSDNWYMAWEKELGRNRNYQLIKYDRVGEWDDPRITIAKNKVNLLLNKNWGAWGTWDIAAGHAILSAVGGATTDFFGDDIDYISGQSMLKLGFASADSMERIKKLPWFGTGREVYEKEFEVKL